MRLVQTEDQLLEVRREGEIIASRFRLMIVAVAMIIPMAHVLYEPSDPEPWLGVITATLIIAIGVPFARLAERPSPPEWLYVTSCLLDVTMVSIANATFVLTDQPLAATNGRVFFPVYLLALSLSALRNDVRLCVISGVAAVVEYSAIVFWAVHTGHVFGFIHPIYGTFRWDNQLARVLVMGMMTAVNVAIIRQTHRYFAQSIYDSLTGLPNRRYARQRLYDALEMVARSHAPIVVAIADLDLFKSVNDRYGHAAGDAVLRHTARMLRKHFRASDLVARYGGEEFLIVLYDSDIAVALERLGRFRIAFAENPISTDGETIMATVSIGVAVHPEDGGTPDQLIARADQRLYEAKRRGRDQVVAPMLPAPEIVSRPPSRRIERPGDSEGDRRLPL